MKRHFFEELRRTSQDLCELDSDSHKSWDVCLNSVIILQKVAFPFFWCSPVWIRKNSESVKSQSDLLLFCYLCCFFIGYFMLLVFCIICFLFVVVVFVDVFLLLLFFCFLRCHGHGMETMFCPMSAKRNSCFLSHIRHNTNIFCPRSATSQNILRPLHVRSGNIFRPTPVNLTYVLNRYNVNTYNMFGQKTWNI